jgi:DNA gyrase subunit A
MAETAREIIRVNIEDEVRKSYLDYAMSVIVGRALPDVRDGLKPVHRRVLFAMQELNNVWNRPYVKCARVVGDVIGKFHPHGDTAVYDALVRMAQDFSLRYPLIDGQGNFGSVDGDNAAAMRYTECRLDRLTSEILSDLDKETVDFVPNYDEKELEPSVLPTRVPNLLVNGSAGIAVGMATNVPPHNLSEVLAACIALIDDPELGFDELLQLIPGPDFPTAGIINGASGIVEAYKTGRGRILLRAKAEIETHDNGRESIVVTEIPYQVNKARLIEKIAELVKEKKIEGISELRDESDKDGMRVVIDVRKDTMADVLLNNLYQQTQLQVTFGINMVALVDGQPRTLSLREILDAFIRHRREVVTRRTIFDLRKARSRAHIVEGLTVALANIDAMVELIKTSPSPDVAKERMLARRWEPGMVGALLAAAGADASRPEDLDPLVGLKSDGYQLSDIQATQILEMRLSRLTGLEQEKLSDEYRELLATIAGLIEILENPDVLLKLIRDEFVALKEQYGDERRTLIQASQEDLDILDLIEPEDVVVTLSHAGYAKRQPVSLYRAQRRGGKGRSATNMKEEDFVERLWIANTHDTLLVFTSAGRVYWLKVFKLPDAGPNTRGKPIVNLLPLLEGEKCRRSCPCASTRRIASCSSPRATARSRRRRSPSSRSSCRRARSRSASTKAMRSSTSNSPTARATSCCSPRTVAPCASPKTKCARWAAPRAACAASASPTMRRSCPCSSSSTRPSRKATMTTRTTWRKAKQSPTTRTRTKFACLLPPNAATASARRCRSIRARVAASAASSASSVPSATAASSAPCCSTTRTR